ncbi:MAG: YkgJ family cysteine cluster protein [Dehalococcoidales bacterium]|nr:YkgJ family cysteine cluster protein [Dehalococcoidales bacterium]
MINQNQILYSKLQASKQIADINNALEEYYKNNDTNFKEYITARGIKIVCQSGCSYCCNIRVDTRPYEIFLIAQHITSFPDNERNQIMTNLEEHKKTLSKIKTMIEHFSMNIPCPLLFGNICSIYPVRPLLCRAYYSLGVSSCLYSYNHPSDLKEKRPTDSDLDKIWNEQVAGSVASIFQQNGYDISEHELGTALLDSLHSATARKRWKNKKKAFVGLKTYHND